MFYKRLVSSFALAALSAIAVAQVRSQGLVQHLPVKQVSARGTADQQAVFDTRIGEQITSTILGGNLGRPENPLIRARRVSNLLPSPISLGGLMSESRTATRVLFPGIVQDQWSPPDCTIAVGPNYVVQTTNMKIAFFTKSGTKVFERWLGNQDALGFFRPVGALGFTFDPKCLYDRTTGRFIVLALEQYSGPNRSFMCIGVSDDSDPNGNWYLYRVDCKKVIGGSEYWVDYPGLGVDQSAIYVTGNLFGFSSGFGGVLFRGIPIASLLSGGALSYFDFIDSGAASVQAAHAYGTPGAAYFVSDWNTTSMELHAIRNPLGTPTLHSALVSVPSYAYPNSDAPQQGGSSRLDTLDGRVMNVQWRNGRLIASHAVRPSGAVSYTVGRWYEFATNSWPASGSPSLIQSGNIETVSAYMLFPVVAFNGFNDIGVCIGRSSTSQFAGVYTTGRKVTDPAGAMGALTLARLGTAHYTGGRWGDYFAVEVDPADDLTFWGVGEYADASGSWSTWITSWQVASYSRVNVRARYGFISTGIQWIDGMTVNATTDGFGNGDGVTPFSRTYYTGANISLTAPQAFGPYRFLRWMINGVPQAAGVRTINVTLSGDTSAMPEYIRVSG